MSDYPSNSPRITRQSSNGHNGRHLSAEDTTAIPAPVTDQMPAAYQAAQAYSEPLPPPIMIRRARPAVFIPPQPEEQGQLISRDLGVRRIEKPELSRNRKIAGNLPAWDPLPPGEIHAIHRRPSRGPR
jgi:hypothetical protein